MVGALQTEEPNLTRRFHSYLREKSARKVKRKVKGIFPTVNKTFTQVPVCVKASSPRYRDGYSRKGYTDIVD